jgi:hypothetical protein
MKLFAGIVALSCVAAAHGQLANPGQVTVPGTFAPGTSNIRFQTMSQGVDSKQNLNGMFLFNEPTGWENYWRANHRGPAPQLEQGFFYNWRILAIHVGNRPTSGYGLAVMGMNRRIDKATVNLVEYTPPRGSRNAQVVTSPWIILRVETGAFDFQLQSRQIAGYPAGAQYVQGGQTIKIGGTTITFLPNNYGCDHCRHRNRGDCRCEKGCKDCDCRDRG